MDYITDNLLTLDDCFHKVSFPSEGALGTGGVMTGNL